MDQIRNTIKRHEALFKEQVQALHKLYNVQKSAMQEIGRIHSHAQILACNSKSFLLADDRYSGSVLDVKHLRPSYATGQAYKDESLNLSLHPFYALDHKGCGSSCMDSRGVETLQTAQSKQIRNFDLEKLPEEYMDESENQIEPNGSKRSDENSILVKRTTNTDGDSSVVANLSVDSPSLKQTYPETNLRILSVNGQEIIQKIFQECTIENKTSQDFSRMYLPAVGKSAYQDARHIEKQTLLHQGSLNFITPTCNPVNSGKDDTEKVPEQANGLIVKGLFPKNPVICSQGSSTLYSVQCDSTYSKGLLNQRSLSLKTNSASGNQDLNAFPLTSQTSTANEVENPNDSEDGSNSIQSQYTKSCKDEDIISIDLKDTPGLGDACCEAVQTSHGGEETVQSECEEVPHVIKDGLLCSTLSDSEVKQIDQSMGNEHLKDKSALRETCESIAAEILLSLAPCTSQVEHQLHGTQTKAELLNFCQRRHANNFQGGGGASTESIKWPKTVNRRSTRRRPR